MADLKALKGKGKANRFGDLAPEDETPSVLEAPESAPAEPTPTKKGTRTKTGRTKTWGTTVAPDFPQRLKLAAIKRNMSQVELLEFWLEREEKEEN